MMLERLFAQENTDSMEFMQRESASMTEMDRAMNAAPMNGNVDHDFVTMMLPHHQGAIDMAKSELLFGKARRCDGSRRRSSSTRNRRSTR
jgi:uncharacterized protein (DUF305 family)